MKRKVSDEDDSEGGSNKDMDEDDSEEQQKLKTEYEDSKNEYKNKSKYINVSTISPVLSSQNEHFSISNYEIEQTMNGEDLFKQLNKRIQVNTKMIPCCMPYSMKGSIMYSSDSIATVVFQMSYKYRINTVNYSLKMLEDYLRKRASIAHLKQKNITPSTPNYEFQLKNAIDDTYQTNVPLYWEPIQRYLSGYKQYLLAKNQYYVLNTRDEIIELNVCEKIINTRKSSGMIKYVIKPKAPFRSSIYIPIGWKFTIITINMNSYQINNNIRCISCYQSYLLLRNKMIKSYKQMKRDYFKYDNKSIVNGTSIVQEIDKVNQRRHDIELNYSAEYTTYDKIINKKDLSKYKAISVKYLKKPIRISQNRWGNIRVRLLASGASKEYFRRKKAYYINYDKENENYFIYSDDVTVGTYYSFEVMLRLSEYSFIGKAPISDETTIGSTIIKYNVYTVYFEFLLEVTKKENSTEEDSLLYKLSKLENVTVSVYLVSKGNFKRLDGESDEEYSKRVSGKTDAVILRAMEENQNGEYPINNSTTVCLGSDIMSLEEFEKGSNDDNNDDDDDDDDDESTSTKFIKKCTIVASLKGCVMKHTDYFQVIVQNFDRSKFSSKLYTNSYIKYKLYQNYFDISTEDSRIKVKNYG